MNRKPVSMEEVIREIEELKRSPYVALARKEMALRQRLYNLRYMEKMGREAAKRQGEEK